VPSSLISISIFVTGKFFKEQTEEKKDNIYSNIDDMLSSSLKPEDE
jgi:segregation and condensation protein B